MLPAVNGADSEDVDSGDVDSGDVDSGDADFRRAITAAVPPQPVL